MSERLLLSDFGGRRGSIRWNRGNSAVTSAPVLPTLPDADAVADADAEDDPRRPVLMLEVSNVDGPRGSAKLRGLTAE